MKTSSSIFPLIFFLQFSGIAQAECLPVACYVEKASIVSCEVVSGVIPDARRLQRLGISQKRLD